VLSLYLGYISIRCGGWHEAAAGYLELAELEREPVDWREYMLEREMPSEEGYLDEVAVGWKASVPLS
jgi:hypothetical protein